MVLRVACSFSSRESDQLPNRCSSFSPPLIASPDNPLISLRLRRMEGDDLWGNNLLGITAEDLARVGQADGGILRPAALAAAAVPPHHLLAVAPPRHLQAAAPPQHLQAEFASRLLAAAMQNPHLMHAALGGHHMAGQQRMSAAAAALPLQGAPQQQQQQLPTTAACVVCRRCRTPITAGITSAAGRATGPWNEGHMMRRKMAMRSNGDIRRNKKEASMTWQCTSDLHQRPIETLADVDRCGRYSSISTEKTHRCGTHTERTHIGQWKHTLT